MRKFIDLIERVQRAPFRLHPGLNPEDFQITGSLGDVQKWKSRIFDANSADEKQKIGDWDEVGYVMISLNDDTIVPIARADEHHRGEDTMWDHVERRKVKGLTPGDYIPLFWSSNYIYNAGEVPPMLIVCRKYLAYGGMDSLLQGANDLSGMAMKMSDFVERGGDVTIAPDTLAPLGKHFIGLLDQLQNDCAAARSPSAMRSALGRAGRSADAIIDFFATIPFLWIKLGQWPSGGMTATIMTWRQQIRDFVSSGDAQGLEGMWFGFGIKNTMHRALREVISELAHGRQPWEAEGMKSFWGNLDLANDVMGRY